MKRIIIGMAALVASALPAMAAEVAYNQQFVNQVVTTTTTFVLDLNAYGIDAVSFQATVSSAPTIAQTFNDGTVSTGSLTVVSTTSIIAQQSSDTIIISNNLALSPIASTDTIVFISTANSGVNGSTIVVNGSSYTFSTAGAGYLVTWDAGSSTQTVVNFVSAFNTVGNIFHASVVASTGVLITCDSPGTQCNGLIVTSSTQAAAAVQSSTFKLGSNNSYFTLNGYQFVQGSQWTADVSYSTNTAVSIMNAVNTTFPSTILASTPTSTSILMTVIQPGTAGNSYTLSVSTPALAISTGVFRGGQNAQFITINGNVITASTFTATSTGTFKVQATLAATATEIQNAINDSVSLASVIIATCPSGSVIVYTTSTHVGSNVGYAIWSSSQTALKWNNTSMTGGTTSAYTISTPLISIPSHGYATGEEVKFSTGSTFALAPLTNQTSYYIISVDANDIELATTSTGAIAGTYITLTSSSVAGPHNFSLTPLPLTQSAVLTWAESNDGVNWSTSTVTASNVTIPVNTLSTPWTTTNYGYDFGPIAYRYLRLSVTGPGVAGNGGFNTVVTGYGKRYWR